MLYLHNTSCHPPKTIRSIPYCLAVRAQRIANKPEKALEYTDTVKTKLISRGYDQDLVEKQFHRAKQIHQNKNPATKNPNPVTPLVTTYFPKLDQQLRSIVHIAYPILAASPETATLVPRPPTITFRQPPSLRNILSHTDPSTKTQRPPNGSFPCNNADKQDNRGRKCETCSIIKPCKSFISPITGTSYPVRGHNTCTSSNVIYKLDCTQEIENPNTKQKEQCKAFYVGLTTQTLRNRMSGHRADVKQAAVLQNSCKPVAEHAASHGITDFNKCFTTTAIRNIQGNPNYSVMRREELACQMVLKSRQAENKPGLNLR